MLKAGLKLLVTYVLFVQLLVSPSAVADTLIIATASNFRPVLEQLSQEFSAQHQDTKNEIKISSASSGVLYAQILRGAPFQLFFSANESFPEKLVSSGHGVKNTLATYAIGQLVLVSRRQGGSPKDILSKAERIAIANPRTAPYGIAAMAVMKSLDIAQHKEKLVVGNNIAQAWQFFHSGNADTAIVAASLIYSAEIKLAVGLKEEQKGLFTLDLSGYLKQPIRQSRVAIKPVSQLTQQFLDFMNTPAAEKIMTDGGYLLPTPIAP